ncbi:hypothetical protein PTMSG1_04873 [Pyrenophora teres f. maculata]|nr:hypothetical protein PTMSG1_04873 [Pyrenophora teres f. maculata]
MSNQREPSTESDVLLLSDAETAFSNGRRDTLDSSHHSEPARSKSIGTISKIKLQLDRIRHRSTIEEEKDYDAAVRVHKQRTCQTIRKEWMNVQRGLVQSSAFGPLGEPALETLDEVFERWKGVRDGGEMQPSMERSLETIGEGEGLDFLESDTAVSSPNLGDDECKIGKEGDEK